MIRSAFAGAICALAAATPALPAIAQGVTVPQKSAYASIDLKSSCRTVKSHPDGNAYLCRGLDGYPIYVAEGDNRTFIASSLDPEHAEAAHQTLSAFNTPFRRASVRATAEFRFTIKEGRKVPFAMIVRYFTSLDGKKGEVIVVSRIAGKENCHMAYVDALANPDAIVLARQIADQRARQFSCGQGAKVEGESGVSPL